MARKNPEMAIQRELIKWIKVNYPALEYQFCKNEGYKSPATAKLDKLAGAIAGWPDLLLLHKKDGFTYILHLELKTLKGTLNDNQKEWHGRFEATQNRELAIGKGFQDAKDKIVKWIEAI